MVATRSSSGAFETPPRPNKQLGVAKGSVHSKGGRSLKRNGGCEGEYYNLVVQRLFHNSSASFGDNFPDLFPDAKNRTWYQKRVYDQGRNCYYKLLKKYKAVGHAEFGQIHFRELKAKGSLPSSTPPSSVPPSSVSVPLDSADDEVSVIETGSVAEKEAPPSPVPPPLPPKQSPGKQQEIDELCFGITKMTVHSSKYFPFLLNCCVLSFDSHCKLRLFDRASWSI